MTDYPIDMQLVVDPLNPENVVRAGSVYLYDPSDTAGVSPLTLKDPSGLPVLNPLTSNAYGFIPPVVVTIPRVMWKSGTFQGYFYSYDGLRNEALAARVAAEAAVADATASQVAAQAAQASAEAAAATASGGGFALDPTDPDALLITTKTDGSVAVDPADSDALLITT